MNSPVDTALAAILAVVLPLAWGLAVEQLFEWLRTARQRRRARGANRGAGGDQ